MPEGKPKPKPKKPETRRIGVIASQEWRCPFCETFQSADHRRCACGAKRVDSHNAIKG